MILPVVITIINFGANEVGSFSIEYSLTEDVQDLKAGFSEGYGAIQVSGKFGFMDTNANVAIKPRWDWAGDFSEGMACILLNNKIGYINCNGKVVIDPRYEHYSPSVDPYLSSRMMGFKCNINENGVDIWPRLRIGFAFKEGYAPIILGGRYGFIDIGGVLVIGAEYEWADNFFEGKALVRYNSLYGYVAKDGKKIGPLYEEARRFSEGLAGVRKGGKWFFVDHGFNKINNNIYDAVLDFKMGMAPVQINGKWGFVGRNGKMIIDNKYDGVGMYFQGVARAKSADKWGYIDQSGAFVIGPQFYDAKDFSEGHAAISYGKDSDYKYGYINLRGEMVIEPKFSPAYMFHGGFALVGVSIVPGKWGYVDFVGNYKWAPSN